MNATGTTTGTVCAKTTAASQTEAAVAVTFPTGFTLGAFGTWTVGTTSTGWPPDPLNDSTAATAWPGITAPSASNQISGQTVQFTSTDLTASTWYCFNWTSATALTNPAANPNLTGVITTCSNSTNCASTGSGGGTGGNLDTSNWATAVVSNDQIAVTATVSPSFAFSLGSNASALGTLSTSGTAGSAINASVTTNAQRGWDMWAADPGGANIGLHSTTAGHTIAYSPSAGGAVHTLSAEEGANLGVGATAGGTCNSVTIDAKFASGGTSFRGGGLDGTLRTIAVSDGVANACLVPLTYNAMILGSTPAATDYSGTVTVVAAGRF
ncbi:MAG TPA: hypothetical protein VLG27_03060 [Candidatus Saccharimonadia bacterium]|nr:hypothetical protein [Candidatus Saccharimonadia bacterium]